MPNNLHKSHVFLLYVLSIIAIICAILIVRLAYEIFVKESIEHPNTNRQPIIELEVQPAKDMESTEYIKPTENIKFTEDMETIEETNTQEVEKQNLNSNSDSNIELLFSFAGDCTIGGNYPSNGQLASTSEQNSIYDIFTREWIRQGKDNGYFFRLVKPIFEASDLAMVNLEGTLTTSTQRANKKFAFKGHPELAAILKEGSIDIVTLANNHSMDYGLQGYQDTKKALDKYDILYCDENTIAYGIYKDVKVAFLGFPGWYLEVKPKLKKAIHEAKDNAHIVIVSFHWGDERSLTPNEVQMELGRFAIDEGATLVVGHHPHVIQGIEIYKDRYIVYSLANFSFGGNSNPKDKDTFIFQQKFVLDSHTKDIKSLSANIVPCKISSTDERNNFQPMPVEGNEARRILNRIYEASSMFERGFSDEGS